jgi:uncharacterized protein YraI
MVWGTSLSGGSTMPSSKSATSFSSKLRSAIFIGTLIFLVVFASSCDVEQEAIDSAVEQTLTAQAENQSAFSTAVAAEVAAQIGTGGGEELSSDLSGSADEVDTAAPEQVCEEECDARIEEEVAALEAEVEALEAEVEALETELDEAFREATEGLVPTPAPEIGGGEEEDACADGSKSCATNDTDSNINVREGPGVQWPFMTTIPPDPPDQDTVVVLCRLQNGWLNVVLSISLQINGWVSGEFMTLTGPTPDICEEIPPTPKVFPTVTPTPTPTPTHTPTVTPTPTATPKPNIFVFAFNGSSVDVCRLEVFPATDSSGNNRLGSSEILDPLETKSVSLAAYAEEKNYVFKAWDCASNPDSDPPLDEAVLEIDPGMTWTITDP